MDHPPGRPTGGHHGKTHDVMRKRAGPSVRKRERNAGKPHLVNQSLRIAGMRNHHVGDTSTSRTDRPSLQRWPFPLQRKRDCVRLGLSGGPAAADGRPINWRAAVTADAPGGSRRGASVGLASLGLGDARHPHMQMIVPGGGIANDGSRLISYIHALARIAWPTKDFPSDQIAPGTRSLSARARIGHEICHHR